MPLSSIRCEHFRARVLIGERRRRPHPTQIARILVFVPFGVFSGSIAPTDFQMPEPIAKVDLKPLPLPALRDKSALADSARPLRSLRERENCIAVAIGNRPAPNPK